MLLESLSSHDTGVAHQSLMMDLQLTSIHLPSLFLPNLYLEACELMSAELEQRFHCQHIPSVIALEKTMLNAANGSKFRNNITLLEHTFQKLHPVG